MYSACISNWFSFPFSLKLSRTMTQSIVRPSNQEHTVWPHLKKKKGIRYCWVLMLSEWKSVDQIVMRKTWINADLRWKRSLSLFLFASPKIIALRCTLSTLWGRLMADTSHLCMFVNKLLCLFNQKKKTLTWFVLRLNLACIEWTDAKRWFLKFLGNP